MNDAIVLSECTPTRISRCRSTLRMSNFNGVWHCRAAESGRQRRTLTVLSAASVRRGDSAGAQHVPLVGRRRRGSRCPSGTAKTCGSAGCRALRRLRYPACRTISNAARVRDAAGRDCAAQQWLHFGQACAHCGCACLVGHAKPAARQRPSYLGSIPPHKRHCSSCRANVVV